MTITELTNAIETLNKGNAPDFYGMLIEHILNAGDLATQFY